MFEKDAEEYYETETPMIENITGLDFQNEVTKAFQKGAEFGYNKCFEQIRKLVNEHTRLDCIIPELLRLQEKEGK